MTRGRDSLRSSRGFREKGPEKTQSAPGFKKAAGPSCALPGPACSCASLPLSVVHRLYSLSIRPCIQPASHLSTYRSIHPSLRHSSFCPSVHPSTFPPASIIGHLSPIIRFPSSAICVQCVCLVSVCL